MGQAKGKKIRGYREQRRGGSDYSSGTCSTDKQSRLCRRRKNQETSQLLRMPQRYQQVPWCTATRARRCQLPPSLSPRRCSQLRVLCKLAAWTALPRLTPLPPARFRRAPPAVCLHAAALHPSPASTAQRGVMHMGDDANSSGLCSRWPVGLNQARSSLSLACTTLLLRNQPLWLHTGMSRA